MITSPRPRVVQLVSPTIACNSLSSEVKFTCKGVYYRVRVFPLTACEMCTVVFFYR